MIPAPAPMVRPAATLLLGIALSVALWAPSCSSPTYPPGNGWVSKAKPVRLPSESRWIPTWNMSQSTIIMPDNETGMHSVEEALRYGLVSYDWSNAKGIWGKHAPMDDEEYLVKQAGRPRRRCEQGPRWKHESGCIQKHNQGTELDDQRA
jgi:hypothetical protein